MDWQNKKMAFPVSSAFRFTFKPDHLTFGLMAPFKGYWGGIPDISDFDVLAELIDESGLATIWVRDIPSFDPKFGDGGQILDPTSALGNLCVVTKHVALGCAGYIAPLRHPIYLAKEAASIDLLSHQRFLFGLATGDRPTEYTALNLDYEDRGKRFAESWRVIQEILKKDFPNEKTTYYGNLQGNIDFLPKPASPIPMLVIGQARQSISWIANHADAWIWHGVTPSETQKIVNQLDQMNQTGFWCPFGCAYFVKFQSDETAPLEQHRNVLVGGSHALVDYFRSQEEAGLSHALINLEITDGRSPESALDAFLDQVVAKFV